MILATALVILSTATPQTKLTIDFSGVDAFWKIAEKLSRDIEPSDDDWNQLFRTPGYAALEEREHRRAALMSSMRAALKPSLASVAQTPETPIFIQRSTSHLREVWSKRSELKDFEKKWSGNPGLDRALAKVQTLFPDGFMKGRALPKIQVLFFLPDGRGYPTMIIADELKLMHSYNPSGFFAHEFYHYFRRFIANDPEPKTPSDEGIINILVRLTEEGSADQMDKAEIVAMSVEEFDQKMTYPPEKTYYEGYRKSFQAHDEQLSILDTALTKIALNRNSSEEQAKSLNQTLAEEGRPLGAYIASVILEKSGRAKFAAVTGNAFAFLKAYQEIALSSGGKLRPFSATAMTALSMIGTSESACLQP